MYLLANLTHGGQVFATPDRVANCPQPVDKPVDNFLEKKQGRTPLSAPYTNHLNLSNNKPLLNP
jgi:hypothetical protein